MDAAAEILPTGWAWVRLGDVCEEVQKVNLKAQNPTSEFTYLDINAVDNQKFKIVEPKIYKWSDAPSRAQQIVKSGDVLFSTVRTYLKNIAPVPSEFDGQIASTGFCVIRGKAALPRFLFHLTLSNEFLEPLNALQRGTSYPAVRNSDVFGQKLPLPPLPEQARIVKKLEALLARLARAEQALAAAEKGLGQFRQSVLKAAFRAEDADGKLKAGWRWVKLGELKTFSIYGPRFSSDDYAELGIPILRTTDIDSTGKVNLNSAPKIQLSEKEVSKYKCQKGDFLITRTGSIGTLAVFQDEIDAIPGAFLIQYRVNGEILTQFLFHYLKSDFSQKYLLENSAGIGRLNLNVPTIDSLPIPLPNLPTQTQIVKKIETQLTQASHLEAAVKKSKTECARLRQSILREAFAGRLAPQDPADEPAETLLARLRAEKTDRETSVRERSKTRIEKSKNKAMEKNENAKSIVEILQSSAGVPVKALTVWQQSEFWDEDIDGFYKELRTLIEIEKIVKETRDGDISYLVLQHEN